MSKCKLCDFKSVSTAVLVRHKRNEHTTDSTNQSDGVEGVRADSSMPVVAQVGGNQVDARVIRFRAWDIRTRKMVPRFVIPILNDGYVTCGGMGENVVVSKLRQGMLMQYTGLKDKNGVEIFEGDIVNRYGGGLLGDPQEIISSGEVTYQRTSFGISDSKFGHSNMFNESELEVIGNIYENPELLTKGNDLAASDRNANTDHANPPAPTKSTKEDL